MKAAQYTTYGDPSVIDVTTDAPIPSIHEGQVLVEIHAASINPFDYKVRRGYMKDGIPLTFPITLGGDFSGVVTKVAESVTEFSVGDEVFGQTLVVNGGSGSLAEFASVNIKNIAQKPKKSTFLEAASLVLVGVSAVQALEEHIQLASGQKILIHGGAGGIGSVAVQLAKHIGAQVITTVGSDDKEFVKSLGVDEIIDYKTQKFEELLHDIDAVFDTVGGETTTKSILVLKENGVLVSMAGKPDEELAKKHNVRFIAQNTGTRTKRLDRLSELIDDGVIKPQIDKVYSLDQAKEAFEHLENGHPRGKVVIQIKE